MAVESDFWIFADLFTFNKGTFSLVIMTRIVLLKGKNAIKIKFAEHCLICFTRN
jgi:hypothetical protein